MRSLTSNPERQAVTDHLADLLANRGYETFVVAPVLAPTVRFLPDDWSDTPEGALRLVKRLCVYAGLVGEVELVVVARPTLGGEDGMPLMYAGGEGGRLTFEVDCHLLSDSQLVIGVACREVARAYRAHHTLLPHEDADLEEALVDITAVYLGFGIFVTNAAYRYRKSAWEEGGQAVTAWSESTLGDVSAPTMSWLLALQAAVRGLTRWQAEKLAKYLETNQAEYFRTSFKELSRRGDEVRVSLRIPDPESWPEPPDVARFTEPILDTELRIVDRPGSILGSRGTSLGETLERPVFRVREGIGKLMLRSALGTLLGCFVGAFLGMALENSSLLGVGAALGLLSTVPGWWRRGDRCSSPSCGALLAADAGHCSGCGGFIAGRIASPRQHFAAEEELSGTPED